MWRAEVAEKWERRDWPLISIWQVGARQHNKSFEVAKDFSFHHVHNYNG